MNTLDKIPKVATVNEDLLTVLLATYVTIYLFHLLHDLFSLIIIVCYMINLENKMCMVFFVFVFLMQLLGYCYCRTIECYFSHLKLS